MTGAVQVQALVWVEACSIAVLRAAGVVPQYSIHPELVETWRPMCRYELWCIARAAAARYCVLQCSVPEDAARAWNTARPAQQAYSEAVFGDLWSRYEEPDSRNRWDKPLFRVNGLEPQEAGSVLQVGGCSLALQSSLSTLWRQWMGKPHCDQSSPPQEATKNLQMS